MLCVWLATSQKAEYDAYQRNALQTHATSKCAWDAHFVLQKGSANKNREAVDSWFEFEVVVRQLEERLVFKKGFCLAVMYLLRGFGKLILSSFVALP